MALKSKRVYVTFLRDGQIALHASDGRGRRFKMVGNGSKILRPKTRNERLGREVRAMRRHCR